MEVLPLDAGDLEIIAVVRRWANLLAADDFDSAVRFLQPGHGVSVDAAAECLRELSGRSGPMGREYKASQVLRADRRSAVMGLLGPAGPIHGNAFVHLTEKAYFVVDRILDLVLGQSSDAASSGLVPDRRRCAGRRSADPPAVHR